MTDRVKHKARPSEPFAQYNAYGTVTRTFEDGPLRITPAQRTIPAMAHIVWDDVNDIGTYTTWERLADLTFIAKPRKDK